jgi:hypothetical protein
MNAMRIQLTTATLWTPSSDSALAELCPQPKIAARKGVQRLPLCLIGRNYASSPTISSFANGMDGIEISTFLSHSNTSD